MMPKTELCKSKCLPAVVKGSILYSIATTANGWTDDNICVKWLELSFIPAAKAHADLSNPILLIYDGHGSHVTLEMIDKARENNIILYCLPPHTTHRLQPCDVGAFSPLKRAWNKHCDHVFQTTGEPLKAQNFVQEYMAARNESFKPDTIMKAWENSGIHVGEDGPRCTPEIFTESDFAPSHSTSTQLHLPDGYPTLSHDVPITADSADLDDPDSSDNGADDSDSEDEPDDNWNVRIGPSAGTRTYVLSSQLPQSDNTECEANEQSTPSTQSGPTVSSDSDDSSGTLLPLQQCRFLYHDEPDFDCDNLENLSDDELILALKEHITKYRHQRDQARQERDEAAAHATLAALHVASLQAKLNTKVSKRASTRNVVIDGGVVTTERGREIAAQQKAVRLEKEKKAEENSEKRKNAEAEQRVRRIQGGKTGLVFEGTLASQKLPALRDIAWSLGLAEAGTREVLIQRINTHFNNDENNTLKNNSQYSALFGKRAQKRKAVSDENIPSRPPSSAPEAQRRRLELGNTTNFTQAGPSYASTSNPQPPHPFTPPAHLQVMETYQHPQPPAPQYLIPPYTLSQSQPHYPMYPTHPIPRPPVTDSSEWLYSYR